MRPRPRLAGPLAGLVLTLPGMVMGMLMGMVMGGVSAAPPRPPDPPMAEAEIGASVLVAEVQRIGMNLGIWTYWGAEQLARNILKNPGFEGIIDRALVRVAHAGRFRFNDDSARLAREDGFWSGASYEVLTGGGAGERGTLADSRAAGRGGLPEFITTDAVGDLAPGDIIALTRIRDDLPPTHWWLPNAQSGRLWPDPNETPPTSPGRRSLALSPFFGKTMRLSSHLDSIGERAGKLLPVAGRWRLALWVRGGEEGETRLRILFRRHGSPPFIDLSLTPKPGWQRIERLLETKDAGPVGALELLIEVSGAGTLHLDDLWLGPWDPDQGSEGAEQRAREAFRPEVIATLRELGPAWLRDWQGQLGDTLENRLAAPWARRATRYRPEGRGDFLYSLPEFLDLCVAVGANPWLILPTTFSSAEARALGAWLAGRIAADGFTEVLVEYGNENWNSVFRAAGIQDPDRHGAAADRVFAALRAGAGEHPAIRRAVGAQHANPWAVDKVARASSQSDVLAVAPYLLSRLGADDWARALDLLFADDGGRLKQIAGNLPSTGKELAVYEVNLHTTKGDATIDQRAAITTGAAAGPALAKRLLTAMGLGARRQCVWTLAGFDTKLNEGEGLVPLFGVARDLSRGDRLRPTGWAVAMLNRVIAGDLHPAKVGGAGADGLLVAPFRGPDGWSAAVVSALDEPRRLTLRFPSDASPRPAAALLLDASDPFKGNETTDQIRPRALALETLDRDRLALTIPPYSLAVLGPRECCHEP